MTKELSKAIDDELRQARNQGIDAALEILTVRMDKMYNFLQERYTKPYELNILGDKFIRYNETRHRLYTKYRTICALAGEIYRLKQ